MGLKRIPTILKLHAEYRFSALFLKKKNPAVLRLDYLKTRSSLRTCLRILFIVINSDIVNIDLLLLNIEESSMTMTGKTR